jgi:proline iminopeptidase
MHAHHKQYQNSGIFTLRAEELSWYYQSGASFIFPDKWDAFLAPIPAAERHMLMAAYHRRLTGDDETKRLECARAWSIWEKATSRLHVDDAGVAAAADNDKWCLAFARIENHFFCNAGFMQYDGQLIKEADKLVNVPGTIVQGRYDVVCPAKSAWDLSKVRFVLQISRSSFDAMLTLHVNYSRKCFRRRKCLCHTRR